MTHAAQRSPSPAARSQEQPARLRLRELMQQMREIEIDHDGKIYRLRLTQSNKLILTT